MRRKEVFLKAELDSRSRFLTLTHEYAHELLYWDSDSGNRHSRPLFLSPLDAGRAIPARPAPWVLRWFTPVPGLLVSAKRALAALLARPTVRAVGGG